MGKVATKSVDFIVIGAGMAGVSAAFELSHAGSIIVLEQEMQPAYHSTGRSAAMFLETYGNETIRGLTCGSRPFYELPPAFFGQSPVLTPRGAVFIANENELAELQQHFSNVSKLVDSVCWLGKEELYNLVPYLRRHRWNAGVYEPGAQDLDVHAIHQGYLRGLKANGGKVVTAARVHALDRINGNWFVETTTDAYAAPVIVNASGAWGDYISALAGVNPVGLQPKRRTGIIVNPPLEIDTRIMPYVGDIKETFYIKPEGMKLFVSPCDETNIEPCDSIPDEYDVAVAIHRLEEATTVKVKALTAKLAGLRSFVVDRTPVVGFGSDGFFWLVGQGGYGIQTAPAMARLCAALVCGRSVPSDLQDFGVNATALSPQRPSLALSRPRPEPNHPIT